MKAYTLANTTQTTKRTFNLLSYCDENGTGTLPADVLPKL
jgi:hypothetical protein